MNDQTLKDFMIEDVRRIFIDEGNRAEHGINAGIIARVIEICNTTAQLYIIDNHTCMSNSPHKEQNT